MGVGVNCFYSHFLSLNILNFKKSEWQLSLEYCIGKGKEGTYRVARNVLYLVLNGGYMGKYFSSHTLKIKMHFTRLFFTSKREGENFFIEHPQYIFLT